MKRIYTYGEHPATRNLTVADIQANKESGTRMTQVTCESAAEGRAIETCEIDLIICDIEHYDDARAGAPNTFITAVPSMSQYGTTDEILSAVVDVAGRGADAVLTQRSLDVIEAIANEGIAVQDMSDWCPRFPRNLVAYG